MKSEFSLLSDLAIAQGVTHSELIAKIHVAVIEALREQFPKTPIDAVVVVDEVSGDVHIYSEGKDITPAKFKDTAKQVARQTIVNLLHHLQSIRPRPLEPSARVVSQKNTEGISQLIMKLVFWGYNLYFVFFNLFQAVWLRSNYKSLGVATAVSSLVLLFIPLAAIYLAIRNRKTKHSLLQIFFLFELPLAFICLVPMYWIQQTTPFMALLMLAGLSIPAIVYLYSNTSNLSLRFQKISLFIHQFVLMLASYLVFLFSFSVPLIIGYIVTSVTWYSGPMVDSSRIGIAPVSGVSVVTAVLLLGLSLLPFAIVIVLYRAYQRTFNQISLHLPAYKLNQLQLIFTLIILTISSICAYQPSPDRLFKLLSQYNPQASFSQRQAIATQIVSSKSRVKQALQDQQNYRTRYFSTKDDQSLKQSYQMLLGVSDNLSSAIQHTFLLAAYPFVYQADNANSAQILTSYQDIFGEPYWQMEPKAPLDQKNILLLSRTIVTTPDSSGQLATITVDEQYENQTMTQQEAVYEFSLPTGAVVTDLKLGPDLEFPGVIAPRGAAQRTYESQLQIRRDPALLEQIGPDQYRLRIFPIPAKNDLVTLKGKPQRIAYTYITPAEKNGYGLPQFLKKTNIFIDARSRLSYKESETAVAFTKKFDVCQTTLERVTATVTGATASLVPSASDPLLQRLACGKDIELINTLSESAVPTKIAIAYDISAKAENVDIYQQMRDLLASVPSAAKLQVDIIPFNSQLGQIQNQPIPESSSSALTHFGVTPDLSVLSGLTNSSSYQAIFILAAKNSNYATYPFASNPPVFLVYPDRIPAMSQPFITKLVQSRGYATTTFTDAFRRFRITATLAGLIPVNQYFQGQINESPTSLQPSVFTPSTPVSALFNRLQIHSALAKSLYDVSSDITAQDALFKFASSANIITPNASLLALVNQTQKDILQQQSSQYNRYQDQSATTNIPLIQMPQDLIGRTNSLSLPELGAPSTSKYSAGPGVASTSRTPSSFIVLTGVVLFAGLVGFVLSMLRRKPRA